MGGRLDFLSQPQVKPGVQFGQGLAQALQLPLPRLPGQARPQIFIVVAESLHFLSDGLQILLIEPLLGDRILLRLHFSGGVEPLGQVDGQHGYQHGRRRHQQVVKSQEAGLNAV